MSKYELPQYFVTPAPLVLGATKTFLRNQKIIIVAPTGYKCSFIPICWTGSIKSKMSMWFERFVDIYIFGIEMVGLYKFTFLQKFNKCAQVQHKREFLKN